jgi:hypothetical protein
MGVRAIVGRSPRGAAPSSNGRRKSLASSEMTHRNNNNEEEESAQARKALANARPENAANLRGGACVYSQRVYA